MVNFFNVYELDSCPRDLGTNFALGNYLFEDVKLTKNVNNKGKDILILGKDPTQGTNITTLTAKTVY